MTTYNLAALLNTQEVVTRPTPSSGGRRWRHLLRRGAGGPDSAGRRKAEREKKGCGEMRKRIALALLTMLVSLAVAPAVSAESGPTAIPDSLKVPEGNVLLFEIFASGAQIYLCAAAADAPNMFAWTFEAPQAVLWNDAGEQVGTHFAGPAWMGNDGSSVAGEAVAHADSADPGAIPWLLLKAKSHGGMGAFSTVTYVQRLATVGGLASAEGCDQSTAGVERAVPYSATYAFYYGAMQ
ncbi:MAG TPA: DUF3455 domain-containing protein [Dehalococcoidia bacterium]|nr:DUF3455 domain-containing protein [Dehalococcoidia bacterium]